MSGLDIRVDTSGLRKLASAFGEAKGNTRPAIARALNRAVVPTRMKMATVLAPQTGLKPTVTKRALRTKRASPANLAAEVRSEGGNISVKYFKARETRAGVTASPWNARHLYSGAFTRGGRFPTRSKALFGGHAFARTGGSRLPIAHVDSGLFIPTEMVTGRTEAAFHTTARAQLEASLSVELSKLFGGR